MPSRLTLAFVVILALLLPLAAQDAPRLYNLPRANTPAVTSASLISLPNGRVAVANALSDTVSVLDMTRSTLVAEIAVGDEPRSVAATPDNARLLVANRGDGTLSLVDLATSTVESVIAVGGLPVSVVVAGETALVALHGTPQIVLIALETGQVMGRIDTLPQPTGLTLWGDFLYVTHFDSAALSLIFLPTRTVVQTLSLGGSAGLAASLEIDATSAIAYVPHMRLNPAPEAPFDGRARPVVSVIDLATFAVDPSRRYDLDLLDRPVSLPYAAKLDANRTRLYIAHAGSGDVTVIDLRENALAGFFETGSSPRALVLSRDGQNVYAHNAIDQTLTITPTRFLRPFDTLPTTQQPPNPTLQLGAQVFHSARDARLSATGTLACAVCHFDGWSDGRVWRGLNTPALFERPADAPSGWLGTWTDETALDTHIREMQAGTGLGADSLDTAALVAYLRAFLPPAPPAQDADLVARGEALFSEWTCQTCHAGALGTDQQVYDVGTGGQFLTPPLNGLWHSAPYLHDGRAAVLEDVFLRGPGDHRLVYASESDLAALVAYLLSR